MNESAAPASPPLPAIGGSERLVVVVGASGAGKDSLLRAWRSAAPERPVHFARRVITRAPDIHEGHEAVTPGDFAGLRAAGRLATWWRAHELDYGVRADELAALARGGWVVVNGSRAHLPALRAQAPRLRVVEITAPPEVLAARLAARAREDAAALQLRLARRVDVPAAADLVVVNDGALGRGVEVLETWWRTLVGAPGAAG